MVSWGQFSLMLLISGSSTFFCNKTRASESFRSHSEDIFKRSCRMNSICLNFSCLESRQVFDIQTWLKAESGKKSQRDFSLNTWRGTTATGLEQARARARDGKPNEAGRWLLIFHENLMDYGWGSLVGQHSTEVVFVLLTQPNLTNLGITQFCEPSQSTSSNPKILFNSRVT